MGDKKDTAHRHLTLLCLYVAQSIPMSFFSSVVPVIMREEHYSLESIGLLQLIKLPWIFKLFWAPFVDDKTKSLRDYKRWIIGSELFYALIICVISLLSLKINFPLIVGLIVLAFIASATQDIATDALSIQILLKRNRSLGASMQSMGSFIGTMVGSGVLLVIYHQFGWNSLLLGLVGFVLVALVPLLFYKKEVPSAKTADQQETFSRKKKIRLVELLTFFKQKQIFKQVFFLILFYSGIITILAMLRPYLVDLGYSKKEIGYLFGILGTITATICSLLAGFLIRRYGKKNCRVGIAFLILTATIYLLWVSLGHTDPVHIYSGILFLWGTYGMATVIVYTMSMDLARSGREGTDFTLQTVLTHLSGMLLAVLGGQIAGKTSYSWLFGFGVLLSLISFFYNLLIYKTQIPENENLA